MSKNNPSDYHDLDAIMSHLGPPPEIFTPKFEFPEITPISHWLSGDAAFSALKEAVDELTHTAPEDHDVLIQAFNISVVKVRYIEPHTFILSGFNYEGHDTSVVVHFSQLVAHIVYLPKRKEVRVVTGFARDEPQDG